MRYKTAAAFKAALEAHIRTRSESTKETIERLRKVAAFERFVVRIQHDNPNALLLKGGFGMYLRVRERARTTKDVDFAVNLDVVPDRTQAEVLTRLRSQAAYDAGDYFTFAISDGETITPDKTVATFRYSVNSVLSAKTFEGFKVDVSVGNPLVAPAVDLPPSGIFDFAELPPVTFRGISPAQQLAEKVHAMTSREDNSRVHDLVDLLLLLDGELPSTAEVARCIRTIFEARKTHEIPKAPAFPVEWSASYGSAAIDSGVREQKYDDAVKRFSTYWDGLSLP